jgi:hypothetical protein
MGWSGARDEAAPNDEQHEHRDQVGSEQCRRLLAISREVATAGRPPASLDDLACAERRYELRERRKFPADFEYR